jgi:hypothetical protein
MLEKDGTERNIPVITRNIPAVTAEDSNLSHQKAIFLIETWSALNLPENPSPNVSGCAKGMPNWL